MTTKRSIRKVITSRTDRNGKGNYYIEVGKTKHTLYIDGKELDCYVASIYEGADGGFNIHTTDAISERLWKIVYDVVDVEYDMEELFE